MISIAICDNNSFFCEKLKKMLICNFSDSIGLIDISYSGEQLINKIICFDCKYDIIFLDLVIPNSNGIDIGRRLRQTKNCHDSLLIYMSNYSPEINIFDIHPFTFMPKDSSSALICSKTSEAIDFLTDNTEYFVFRHHSNIFRIPYNQILYIENIKHHSIVHCSKNSYECSNPISKYSSALENKISAFVKTHSSYIVNIKFIKEFRSDYITLQNNAIIPVSRSKKSEVSAKISEMLSFY